MAVVDTHAHVWSTELAWMSWLRDEEFFRPILRDFSIDELLEQLGETGTDSVVLVQAGTDTAETRWYLELAEKYQPVAGVVGWVSLATPEATRRDLESLGSIEHLVGIRHMDGWQPDGRVVIEGRAAASARILAEQGLVLDLHPESWQDLPAVERFLAEVPELSVVLNHLGKPNLLDPAQFAPWQQNMTRIAARPNVVVKYSGWSTRLPQASAEAVRPYLEHLLATFGDDRLLYASNWPVVEMSATYQEISAVSRAAIAALPAPSQERILGGNAERIYGLAS